MASAEPFPFMELPTSIRLRIYEYILRQIHHTKINVKADDERDPHLGLVILITRTCCMALLRVSKTVNFEAKPVIARVTQEWILNHPPRALASFYNGWEELDNFLLCLCAKGQAIKSDAGEALRDDKIDPDSDGEYVHTLGKRFDITAELLQFAQQGARAILDKDDPEVEVVFFRPTMPDIDKNDNKVKANKATGEYEDDKEDDEDEEKDEDDELSMFFTTLFSAESCNALYDEFEANTAVPGILPCHTANTLTPATAKLLTAGFAVSSDGYDDDPRSMSEQEWLDGWLETS
jgi:hypothetical protein